MKKNQYYCIIKNNEVVYISTSERACNKIFEELEGEFYKSQIDTLGLLQNIK